MIHPNQSFKTTVRAIGAMKGPHTSFAGESPRSTQFHFSQCCLPVWANQGGLGVSLAGDLLEGLHGDLLPIELHNGDLGQWRIRSIRSTISVSQTSLPIPPGSFRS